MDNLITTQDYLDSDIVAAKVAAEDFEVQVSPEFEFDGRTFRVLIDGHHSLAAAIEAGVEPIIVEYDSTDDDRIAVLTNSGPDAYLEVMQERDWRYAATGQWVW